MILPETAAESASRRGHTQRGVPYTPLVTRENKLGEEARPKGVAEHVSELTTNRLSVYLRCLNALDTAGVRTISSQALADQFHLNAAQIRKDLAYFGEFGVRGVGYYVGPAKGG